MALAVALAAAACGRGSRESVVAPAPASNAIEIRQTPREQLRRGGVLTWPIPSIPPNFNANHVDGNDTTTNYIASALMPAMFRVDASGAPHWNRDYLASAPVLDTSGTQRVTYVLNPRARWSNGAPITWQDFYWQWKALSGTDPAYQASSSAGYADVANVARGRDDREVVVTFKRRFADWQKLFGPLYPVAANQAPAAFNTTWKAQPATSAGPFRFESLDTAAGTVTLARNDAWWGAPPLLDRIVFRAIDPDAQIDALANGELDVMDVGPDTNKYARVKNVSGVDLRRAGGPNYRHLLLNATSPLLRDVAVRRALARAIDRAAIARAMLGPLGAEPAALGNHLFMRNHSGYRDNSGAMAYDLAAAGRALDEAGWLMDNGIRRKNGAPLVVKCVIPTANATAKQESELIQNMLARAGVTMTITAVPNNVFFPKYVVPGEFDVTLFSWFADAFPISSSRAVYAKPVPGPGQQLIIQLNVARVGSDEIDRLFDAATQELDSAKAIAIGNQIDTLVWQEVHSLPLYQRPEIWAVKQSLANFGAFGLASIAYEDIGWRAGNGR